MAYFAVEDFLGVGVRTLNPVPGSLPLASADLLRAYTRKAPQASDSHPFGYPSNHSMYYKNETVFRGIGESIKQLQSNKTPWLGYFHVWSPHGPYTPQKQFIGLYDKQLEIPFRPRHPLSESRYPPRQLLEYRLHYDEYITNVDHEFGNLFIQLEKAGVLDNTYVIVTSDHGELFERGELGHGTPLLYRPVTHIPLLISVPGQSKRHDVYTPTSSLDLLPTILQIALQPIPGSLGGKILPGFSPASETDRRILSFVAKNNSAFGEIEQASVSMVAWPYELIYYTGYPRIPNSFELYNLADDAYEKKDIIELDTRMAGLLKEELLDLFYSTIKPIPAAS
jgi:arylsulfatase A-like enzyme